MARHKSVLQAGVWKGIRRQEGFDGLVCVLRLHLEPLSPQRSSQPATTFCEIELD
jgi:hypothetical protein